MIEDEQQYGRDWDAIQPGQTMSLNREEFLQEPLENLSDREEQAMGTFVRKLAEDPNIAGVALSRIRMSGQVFTHVFVSDALNGEAMRRTLRVVGGSLNLLEGGGPSAFMHLGEKTFDEIEAKFRADWDMGNPNNPFRPYPNSAELDLLAIIKFE